MLRHNFLGPYLRTLTLVLIILIEFSSAHVYRKYKTKETPAVSSLQPEELEMVKNAFKESNKAIQSIESRHPLDPLSPMEMRLASTIIRYYNTSSDWQFKCIALYEPDKELMYPYFKSATSPPVGLIPRRAKVIIADPVTRIPIFAILNLSSLKVEKWEESKPGEKVGVITVEDNNLAGEIALADPSILTRLAALGYGYNELSNVVLDIWEAGYVEDNPNYAQAMKLVQIFFYGLNGNNDYNYYAHPMGFVAYIELGANVVRGIENQPIQQGFSSTDRRRGSVPKANANFIPNILPPNTIRRDLHRLQISQPEGPSFHVSGREVTWQNFKFRIGYSQREGPHIYTVTFNDKGKIRPVIYRMSLSEVYLSYGDPRPPYHRKSSFDLGNWEFGAASVQLPVHQLCRGGDAYYLEADHHNEQAGTWITQNSICVVEEDAGIQYAYYDDNLGQVIATRAQRLSVSFLVGVGNTNYWVSYRFYTDATIEVAIKVTGILSTNLLAVDVKAPPYGNLVASQVYSQIYQHFFAVRIDADIDGIENTVSVEDLVSVSSKTGPSNPYGNGLTTASTVLKTAGEAPTDLKPGRSWRVSNPNVVNPVSGKPASWRLIPQGENVPNLLTPDSPIRGRIPWANHSLWVLPYDPDQLYASGKYLDCGVSKWTKENPNANIVKKDVVLWHVMNYIHSPDIEDWPALSSLPGNFGFRLRPSNFLSENPAITAPPASEATALDGQKGSAHGWRGEGSH